jgi:hypothetical protein
MDQPVCESAAHLLLLQKTVSDSVPQIDPTGVREEREQVKPKVIVISCLNNLSRNSSPSPRVCIVPLAYPRVVVGYSLGQ